MDILMMYWDSVWRTALVGIADHAPQYRTFGEWAAYKRSLKREPHVKIPPIGAS